MAAWQRREKQWSVISRWRKYRHGSVISWQRHHRRQQRHRGEAAKKWR